MGDACMTDDHNLEQLQAFVTAWVEENYQSDWTQLISVLSSELLTSRSAIAGLAMLLLDDPLAKQSLSKSSNGWNVEQCLKLMLKHINQINIWMDALRDYAVKSRQKSE